MFEKKVKMGPMLIVRIDLQKDKDDEYTYVHTRNSMLKKEVIIAALEGCIKAIKEVE